MKNTTATQAIEFLVELKKEVNPAVGEELDAIVEVLRKDQEENRRLPAEIGQLKTKGVAMAKEIIHQIAVAEGREAAMRIAVDIHQDQFCECPCCCAIHQFLRAQLAKP